MVNNENESIKPVHFGKSTLSEDVMEKRRKLITST